MTDRKHTAGRVPQALPPEDLTAENEFRPEGDETSAVAMEGDVAGAPPVRRAAIVENQTLLGGHPDGSAPALDRLVADHEADDGPGRS